MNENVKKPKKYLKKFKDKKELVNIINKYKYPNGLNGQKISDYKVFELMKNDNVIPDSWSVPSALTEFMNRTKRSGVETIRNITNQTELTINIFDFIKPFLKDIVLTEEEKFHIFWRRKGDNARNQLLDWLTLPYLDIGIPLPDVGNTMAKDFESIGLLDRKTVKKNISEIYTKSWKSKKQITTEKITEEDLN